MKRVIRFLANISGVTERIQVETRKDIGEVLIQDAYWWNGGITYNHAIWDIANFSVLYGERLKEGFIRPDISRIRDEVYRMQSQNLNIFDDREVYGYWNNIKVPHFIDKEKYDGEEGYKPLLRIVWK